MKRLLITAGALLVCGSAHAQMVVVPPPFVVQPPPIIVQPPPIVVAPPPPPVACAAVSYGPPLNLRVWPNGPLIATYWAGTRVVVDGTDGGNWMHVIVPAIGWMFAPYLVPVPCGF